MKSLSTVTEEELDSTKPQKQTTKKENPPPKKPKKSKSDSPPPEDKKPKKESTTKEGHWELPYWVFRDGKKTHMRHISYGVIRKREIPSGFYKASEGSTNFTIMRMVETAKKHKLKEGDF
jgi:hypothetical protein